LSSQPAISEVYSLAARRLGPRWIRSVRQSAKSPHRQNAA
jgi:hypothetical protein